MTKDEVFDEIEKRLNQLNAITECAMKRYKYDKSIIGVKEILSVIDDYVKELKKLNIALQCDDPLKTTEEYNILTGKRINIALEPIRNL